MLGFPSFLVADMFVQHSLDVRYCGFPVRLTFSSIYLKMFTISGIIWLGKYLGVYREHTFVDWV